MWDFMIAGLPRREFKPFPLNKKTPEIVIFQFTALKLRVTAAFEILRYT